MSAPSLYRRHRPRTFEDVVGQEHVVRTLRNAIEHDRVHHAYLFVGSRGTGKTSMAKMLAACLNCEGRDTSPTTEPCGACEPCTSIASATSMDVVEMDAASNNSVDDIRELRDAVAYAPVGGHHKVYILDEAHMLSSAAWNAFLKTLEEPPPRTIFVLATTEAAKVLPTVADRCHRFDFHRPTPEQLARVIGRVAEREEIAIDAEASALVARHATGSYRDALGTLEQLVTYTGGHIAVDDVLAVLGVADAEVLLGAFDAVAAGDPAAALRAAEAASLGGRDLAQVLGDVEAHARALLVVATLGEMPDELRLAPERDRRTEEQAQRVGGAAVVRVLDLVADALRALRDGADARTQLELVLVRAAAPELDPQARALTARIERLERRLTGGAPPAPATPAGRAAAPPDVVEPSPASAGEDGRASGAPTPAGASAPSDAPRPTDDAAGSGDAGAFRGAPSPDGASRAEAAAPDRPAPPADATPIHEGAEAPADEGPGRAAAAGAPRVQDDGPPPWTDEEAGGDAAGAEAAAPSHAPRALAPRPAAPSHAPRPAGTPAGSPVAEHDPPPVHDTEPGPAGAAEELDLALVRDVLPAVRERLSRRGLVAEALRGAAATAIRDGDVVVLGVPREQGFAASTLRDGSGREAVLDALHELLGSRPRLEVELVDAAVPADQPLPEEEAVRRVVEEFDAREVDAVASPGAGPPSESTTTDDADEGGAS